MRTMLVSRVAGRVARTLMVTACTAATLMGSAGIAAADTPSPTAPINASAARAGYVHRIIIPLSSFKERGHYVDCLHPERGVPSHEAPVLNTPCRFPADNAERWSFYQGTNTALRSYRGGPNGYCLDYDGAAYSGNQLITKECSSVKIQYHFVPRGRITIGSTTANVYQLQVASAPRLCVNVPGGRDNSPQIILYTCTTGAANNYFAFFPESFDPHER